MGCKVVERADAATAARTAREMEERIVAGWRYFRREELRCA